MERLCTFPFMTVCCNFSSVTTAVVALWVDAIAAIKVCAVKATVITITGCFVACAVCAVVPALWIHIIHLL